MNGFGDLNKSEKKKNKIPKSSKEQIINQAIQFHLEGNIPEAAKYYQLIINQGCDNHIVFSNYGAIFQGQGKLEEAEKLYRTAIQLNPNYSTAHSNLGNILRDLGKLQEAELSTLRAIELNPDLANAHFNLGNILRVIGKLEEAEKSYRKAIELNSDHANAFFNLGVILKDLGKLEEAEKSYRRVIQLNPNYSIAHANLGNIFRDLGKFQEAEISTRKAIELNPDFADPHSNLGNILRDLGKFQEAEVSTRKAIKLNPDLAEAHYNLGNILRDLGKLQEAELSYRKAIDLKPDFAECYSNLGNLLKDLGKLKEAEVTTRKAIKLNPQFSEAFLNLSILELLQGDYKNGLDNYEFRFKTNKPAVVHGMTRIQRTNNQKLQKGEKLLVVTEQGLGDTLQYMRYIPHLRNQGLEISLCAQEKLHSLIQSSGIDKNPLKTKDASEVSEGKWIPLLSLLRYLNINPKNPIITEPYIFSTNELNNKWKNILSQEKRPIVALNWQGNPNAEKVYHIGRSLPLETFSSLARNNDIKFLSLQKGFGSEQLEHCSFKNKFVQCQAQIDATWDFLENAAIIYNCDLIITSDTSIAHLAGGLGKTTWILLKHFPDWRWGLESESTFWYPSVRLFRQKERNNWKEVMERVSSALVKELKKNEQKS